MNRAMAGRSAYTLPRQDLIGAPNEALEKSKEACPPTLADGVTLVSYGLGLWWCLGGPTWAAIASIVGDELDGRIARATGTCSERGSALDWGADVALTPLALMRLGKETGYETAALVAAPGVLFAQAELRSKDWRPPVGSARAAVMLATIAVGALKR